MKKIFQNRYGRKDSLSYIEFIRGKYSNPENKQYISLLISRMTDIEKINY